jgi:hypothetical protein
MLTDDVTACYGLLFLPILHSFLHQWLPAIKLCREQITGLFFVFPKHETVKQLFWPCSHGCEVTGTERNLQLNHRENHRHRQIFVTLDKDIKPALILCTLVAKRTWPRHAMHTRTDISTSTGLAHEILALLKCYTAYIGSQLRTFRDNISIPCL